jgi:crossover junction endodeoxyribonuclease RusA
MLEHEIEILLPWPPTVNNYYRHTARGVYISRKGAAFTRKVEEEIHEQGLSLELDHSLYVEVVMFPPDRRIRDLDNHMKALQDSLTKAKVWEDDSLIDQLSIYRGEVVRGGLVRLTINDGGPIIPYKKF